MRIGWCWHKRDPKILPRGSSDLDAVDEYARSVSIELDVSFMESAAEYIIAAPKGGQLPLRERTLLALTHQNVAKIASIIEKLSMDKVDAIIQEIQYVFSFTFLF
jgi:hypothetical protein